MLEVRKMFGLKNHLSFEGEAGTDLVGGLVQVLSVEGSTKTQSDARAEQDVVGQGGNTTVVDLSLYQRNTD